MAFLHDVFSCSFPDRQVLDPCPKNLLKPDAQRRHAVRKGINSEKSSTIGEYYEYDSSLRHIEDDTGSDCAGCQQDRVVGQTNPSTVFKLVHACHPAGTFHSGIRRYLG